MDGCKCELKTSSGNESVDAFHCQASSEGVFNLFIHGVSGLCTKPCESVTADSQSVSCFLKWRMW